MATIQLTDGQTFEYPDEIAGNDDLLRTALAPLIPEVRNGEIKREVKEGVMIVTIIKRAGTLGAPVAETNSKDSPFTFSNPMRFSGGEYHEILVTAGIKSLETQLRVLRAMIEPKQTGREHSAFSFADLYGCLRGQVESDESEIDAALYSLREDEEAIQ